MNRKQRRELRKDKNLIRNLYAIIQKYFPELFDKFYNLTDTRNPPSFAVAFFQMFIQDR